MEPFVPNWRDPAVLHLRRPRGPDRLSGKTFFLRLWCVTTDWPDWGDPVTALRVRPHVDQWTIRTVTLESNQEPQQCFSHLNQVADFGYLVKVCLYLSTQTGGRKHVFVCTGLDYHKKCNQNGDVPTLQLHGAWLSWTARGGIDVDTHTCWFGKITTRVFKILLRGNNQKNVTIKSWTETISFFPFCFLSMPSHASH